MIRIARIPAIPRIIFFIPRPSFLKTGCVLVFYFLFPLFSFHANSQGSQIESTSSRTLISGFPARIAGSLEENSLKCGVEEWKSRAALSL
jgi:hypothetical protein